jgi:eukaryotic-like serine/threonine-protein kinase
MPPPLSLPPPVDAVSATGGGLTLDKVSRSMLARGSAEVLAAERTVQAGTGLWFIAALGALGALLLQLFESRTWTHYLATGALLLLASLALLQHWRLKRGAARADSWSTTSVAVCATLVALALIAHIGPFSMTAMVLPVLVYYFGMSDLHTRALLIYLLCAFGFFVVAVLGATGVLPLTGTLLPLAVDDPEGAALFIGFGEVVLAGTFALGKRSRRGTREAMRQLEKARRELVRHGALLAEAHADLDRAIDAGRIGRFTGSLVGPYRTEEVLGRGGMGEVYRALHDGTGEPAAIKVLHPGMQDDPDQLARFFREAEIAGALSSGHIVRVHETGRADDGSPYIAMELLHGYDLAQALRKRRRLSEGDILRLTTEVARALRAAQDAGIVHRDIKPQNLFLAREGEAAHWKVLDFGVSKMASVAVTLTHGAIVGTPGYMSPEQARGLEVDARSDIFSLGAIVYRVLTGHPPFSSPDPLVTLDRVARTMPARPTDLTRVHPDVDLALALALAKDRRRRYATAPDFASALADAFAGRLDDSLKTAARAVLDANPWSEPAALANQDVASASRLSAGELPVREA